MFGNLMGKLQEVQQKAEEAKASLAAARYESTSAGEKVKAVVDGNGKLVSVCIDESLLSEGAVKAEEMVYEAISYAQSKAAVASAEVMKNAAKSFLPGFPGL